MIASAVGTTRAHCSSHVMNILDSKLRAINTLAQCTRFTSQSLSVDTHHEAQEMQYPAADDATSQLTSPRQSASIGHRRLRDTQVLPAEVVPTDAASADLHRWSP